MTTLTQPTRRPPATRGLGALLVVQALLYVREPVAVFFTIAFAPLNLILFGIIYGNRPTDVFGGRGAMDVAVPAFIGLIIVLVALVGIPIQTTTSRELGVLRRLRITPLRPLTYMVADVSTYYLMALLGTILLIVVGALAFHAHRQGSLLAVLAGFTLSALAFFALGYLLGSLAPSARVAQTIGMLLAFPMMFLSGATIPLAYMPAAVHHISKYIPLTYVVDLIQGLWYGHSWASVRVDVAVLTGILIVATAITTRVFRWE